MGGVGGGEGGRGKGRGGWWQGLVEGVGLAVGGPREEGWAELDGLKALVFCPCACFQNVFRITPNCLATQASGISSLIYQ